MQKMKTSSVKGKKKGEGAPHLLGDYTIKSFMFSFDKV